MSDSTANVRSPARAAKPAGSSSRRIAAMMLRYWYLLRSSWPRLLDLVYWPTVQMVTWGFLQYYITTNAGFFARAGGTFIGAVLLWDILFSPYGATERISFPYYFVTLMTCWAMAPQKAALTIRSVARGKIDTALTPRPQH